MDNKRLEELASRERKALLIFVLGLFAFVAICNALAIILDNWGTIVAWVSNLQFCHREPNLVVGNVGQP